MQNNVEIKLSFYVYAVCIFYSALHIQNRDCLKMYNLIQQTQSNKNEV